MYKKYVIYYIVYIIHTHTQQNIIQPLKNKDMLSSTTLDSEGIMLSEIKSEDIYRMISLIHGV